MSIRSFLCALALMPVAASAGEIYVYSAQQEHLIRPMLNRFEENTGVTVHVTTGKPEALVSRLQLEGEDSEADVLLTADIGNIYRAQELGLVQPAQSALLEARIPEHLRDPNGLWFGFTVRARAIFYHKDKVNPEEITSYADLADPKWNKQVLIRSSSNMYNQSLTAAILAHEGEEKTRAWLDSLVANLARSPQGGDTDQLRALAAGEGSIAVANTYYYGRLIAGDADARDTDVAEKIGIIFPDQDGNGTHINIRGGGITSSTNNEADARALLEFLASDEAQSMFAETNFEYPAVAGVAAPAVVAGWGAFKQDTLSLKEIGRLNRQAVTLMDKAGWE